MTEEENNKTAPATPDSSSEAEASPEQEASPNKEASPKQETSSKEKKGPTAKKPSKAQKPTQQRSTIFLVLLSLTLSSACIGFLLWGLTKLQRLETEFALSQSKQTASKIETNINTLKQNLLKQTQQLTQTTQFIEQQTQEVQQLKQKMLQLEARWQSAFKSTQLERQISQLNTLLNDAQRQLFSSQSVRLTKQSLNMALKECDSIHSGTVQHVCDAIRTDLKRLSTTKMPDHTTLIEEIEQLRIWIEKGLFKKLALMKSDIKPEKENTSSATADDTLYNQEVIPDNLYGKWQLAAKRLKAYAETHFITIHRKQPDSLIHLTLDQTAQLKHYIDSLLLQARNGIVQKNDKLYQHALTELSQFIHTHQADFEVFYRETTRTVDKLQQASLSMPPDLSLKASQLLNQIRDSLHQEAPR